jgi:hypothetical protein
VRELQRTFDTFRLYEVNATTACRPSRVECDRNRPFWVSCHEVQSKRAYALPRTPCLRIDALRREHRRVLLPAKLGYRTGGLRFESRFQLPAESSVKRGPPLAPMDVAPMLNHLG